MGLFGEDIKGVLIILEPGFRRNDGLKPCFFRLKDDNPTNTFPFVTIGLILANCLVFYHQMTLSLPARQKFVFQWGAIPYQIVHGEILYGNGLSPPS